MVVIYILYYSSIKEWILIKKENSKYSLENKNVSMHIEGVMSVPGLHIEWFTWGSNKIERFLWIWFDSRNVKYQSDLVFDIGVKKVFVEDWRFRSVCQQSILYRD